MRERALVHVAGPPGVEAPDGALGMLLDEQPLAPAPEPALPEAPSLPEIVALARTPSHRSLVRAFLDRAGHAVITALLSAGIADDEIRAHAHRRRVGPAGPGNFVSARRRSAGNSEAASGGCAHRGSCGSPC